MEVVKGNLVKRRLDRRKLLGRLTHSGKVIFRTLFLIGMGFVLLYPVLFILSNAFKAQVDFIDPSIVWIPKHVTFQNIVYAAGFIRYGEAVMNTLKISIPSIILQIFSCMLVGYGFARFKFREKSILFALLIFTIIVPPQTIIVPLYVNFRFFNFFGLGKLIGLITGKALTANLLNTPWTFYLPSAFGTGLRSGLYIFIFRQFFRGMPMELEEAAKIDGCGPFMTFWRVMVPNATTAILTVLLFSIVWHWNDYYLSAMYYNSNFPLSVSLATIQGRLNPQNLMPGDDIYLIKDAILESGCLLSITPILVIYIITQKYFTESIERTGIVG